MGGWLTTILSPDECAYGGSETNLKPRCEVSTYDRAPRSIISMATLGDLYDGSYIVLFWCSYRTQSDLSQSATARLSIADNPILRPPCAGREITQSFFESCYACPYDVDEEVLRGTHEVVRSLLRGGIQVEIQRQGAGYPRYVAQQYVLSLPILCQGRAGYLNLATWLLASSRLRKQLGRSSPTWLERPGADPWG